MNTIAYHTPGVHVQDVPPAPGPIQGASTSVAAFVGATASGPAVGTVNALTGYRAFIDLFKDPGDNSLPTDLGFRYLAGSVYGFFNNGGTRCYVTRVSSDESTTDPSSTQANSKELKQWRKDVVDEVASWLQSHDAPAPSAAQKKELSDLLATLSTQTPEQLESALVAWLQALNWKQAAKDVAKLVDNVLLPGLIQLLQRMEGALNSVFESAEAAMLSSSSITTALALLEPYDDISMVAAPGLTGNDQWSALVNHCANNAPNCFAVLDAPRDAGWEDSPPVPDQVLQNPDYAAIYYPWIKVANPAGGEDLTVPPSGHVAGVYARVDAERGVFKAPANESIYGALDLPVYISNKQQQRLNDGKYNDPTNGINVNCIRRLNGGILIWGARTVQTDDNGQFTYVSTRRTFNYIRQSLENGTQWAVFEPNTPALWGQITRNVTSFLTTLWQDGGLFGSTAAEAFYVKCDSETNPESVRDAGQVITEVGVAITKPAEFVVFQLGLTSGSATPSTSA